MTTIAYDQPVADFIDGLDATGHVTHTAYRKTSVTFHHNGGRLSLQGILDVWKTRAASAHFQSDGQGRLGQYVRVNEYAWATGSTEGNRSSISIEMANATLAPDYVVADATWKSATRLAGWLFWRVIGAAPTPETVHLHHDWKSTSCAGPYIDSIREDLFQGVLAAYKAFLAGTASPTPAPVLEDDMIRLIATDRDDDILCVDHGAHTYWRVAGTTQLKWLTNQGVQMLEGRQPFAMVADYADVTDVIRKADGGDVDEAAVVAGLLPQITVALDGKVGASKEEIAELLRGITLRAS